MRDKNEDIHVFIIEEERRRNREQALKEKALREKLQQPSAELVRDLLGSLPVPEGPAEKEAASSSEENQSTGGVVEHVETGNRGRELFKVGVFGFRLETEVGISSALAVFSFISIIVLLQIEALMNQNLHSGGLQILKGATPYWIAINAALGMFWVMMIARNILRARSMRRQPQIPETQT